jgi:hypothetical protein
MFNDNTHVLKFTSKVKSNTLSTNKLGISFNLFFNKYEYVY